MIVIIAKKIISKYQNKMPKNSLALFIPFCPIMGHTQHFTVINAR